MARTAPYCIFCGKQPTTREHIWADWLKKYIPKNMVNHTLSMVVLDKDQVEITKKKWGGDPRSRQLKIVCRDCNGGWMHDLQDEAKPIIIPLLTGQRKVLNKSQQATLAAWAAMTIICAEYLQPTRLTISVVDRRYLFKNRSPPNSFRIWIGNYRRGNWVPHWIHNSLRISEHEGAQSWTVHPDGTPRANTQITTFVAGHLYLHVFSCPFPEILHGVRLNRRGTSLLAPIWPLKESAIGWPPYAMTDRDADQMAASIFMGLDAIGRRFGSLSFGRASSSR